jgi:hypothetical protein
MAAGMTQAVSSICLKQALVSGDDADTDIAVTGLGANDTLVAVMEFAATTAIPTSRLATTSITEAGVIQCTASTAGDLLWVWWHDADA